MTTYSSLSHELSCRLEDMAAMPTKRSYPEEHLRPSDIAIDMASTVANSIITHPGCRLRRLNISVAPDGDVLFSLIGPNGQDIDLWVDTDGTRATWVADSGHGSEMHEGSLPCDRCGELLPWLFGEGPLPVTADATIATGGE